MQDLDLVGQLGGQAVGDGAGAVGRAIVDDEDPVAVGGGGADDVEARAHDGLEVLGLVVRGQDEPGGGTGGVPEQGVGTPTLTSASVSDLTNSQIATALDELGDLYELDGAIIHRVVAYRTAAKAVRESSTSVAALARDGKATSLPGVGKTLQDKIVTLLETGDTPSAQRLRAKFPPGLIEMTRAVPGLGPKRARVLYDELGIDSIDALREAAANQAIRGVRGFGAKAEENILASLAASTPGTCPGCACCCPRRWPPPTRSWRRCGRTRPPSTWSWRARRGGWPTRQGPRRDRDGTRAGGAGLGAERARDRSSRPGAQPTPARAAAPTPACRST